LAELAAEVLGALLGRRGDHAGSRRMDLPGVLVRPGAGHAGDDPAQRHLYVVEAVTLAVEDHDLVRAELPYAAECLGVDADVRTGGCGVHAAQYRKLR
jgi:hypothetical protein